MIDSKDRQIILLCEIEEDTDVSATCYIDHVESQAVIRLLDNQRDFDNDEPCNINSCPREADEVASVLAYIVTMYDDNIL